MKTGVFGNRTRRAAKPAAREWTTKRELAMYYFPDSTPDASVARLRRWIAADAELRKELLAQGYRPFVRAITPRQLRVFRKYLS